MLRVADLHTELIGKIAKLHPMAVHLEEEYENLFQIGNKGLVERLMFYQEEHQMQMRFIFIDEKPFTKHNLTFYCLKEISSVRNHKACGDWHWLTLDQLIICL